MGKPNNYYRLEMVCERDGNEYVTIRKILNGEERVADKDKYIVDGEGVPYKFEEIVDAVLWLNKYIVYELIDTEYRKPKQDNFLNVKGKNLINKGTVGNISVV